MDEVNGTFRSDIRQFVFDVVNLQANFSYSLENLGDWCKSKLIADKLAIWNILFEECSEYFFARFEIA